MSYDLDNWDTKELKDFVLPLEELKQLEINDWPSILDAPAQVIRLTDHEYIESFHLEGTLTSDGFIVTEFWMQGEGASWEYSDHIIPLFKQSRGYMKALLVWESGDTVEYLYVKDGVVTAEKL